MPTLKEKLEQLHKWAKDDQAFWDVITSLRGPDSPSETPGMSQEESQAAYRKRRERKRLTVEVIRGKAAPGVGGARYRQDISHVTLPPQDEWDHFDRHVARAAVALGLEIRYSQGTAKKTPIEKGPDKKEPSLKEMGKTIFGEPLPPGLPLTTAAPKIPAELEGSPLAKVASWAWYYGANVSAWSSSAVIQWIGLGKPTISLDTYSSLGTWNGQQVTALKKVFGNKLTYTLWAEMQVPAYEKTPLNLFTVSGDLTNGTLTYDEEIPF